MSATPVLGWLVGYTRVDDSLWVFAMNLDLGATDVDTQIDPQVRQRVSREILIAEGALPE